MKVAIITADKRISYYYKEQICYLFGDALIVSSYSTEENELSTIEENDVYIVTNITFDSYEDVMQIIPKNKFIVLATVTIENEAIKKLKSYPPTTKALLVNTTEKMSAECIATLYQKGVSNILFYPYYPGCKENYGDVDLVVTPSEQRFVPSNLMKKILDIGNRIFDEKTIIEIATVTQNEYLLNTERFINYFKRINSEYTGFTKLIESTNFIRNQFYSVLHNLKIGILGINSMNEIFYCNEEAAKLLCKKSINILNKKTIDIFRKNYFEQENHFIEEIYVNKFGEKLLIRQLAKENEEYIFVTIYKTEKSEEDKRLSSEIIKKGYTANYTFEDIIGETKLIKKAKEISSKMAKTDFPVLITGETGVGKELFAHSIHMSSKRRNNPFVAINCMALSDSLLESELFGYSGGAFTGARKEGKRGLFEIADKGTLFLDEIESMSINLQIKLLRAVQEQEIMRVGGDRIISVDVRIIATSNENLLKLVEKGLFRKDLYYRLNVLPVEVPPLRNRKEDLFILLELFKKKLNFKFIFTDEAKSFFKTYDWPGNVRELQNCVEYLYCLEKKIIDVKLLPSYIKNKPNEMIKEVDLEREIIFIIEKLNLIGETSGRKKILSYLKNKNIKITEAKIKKILKKMKEEGYIEVFLGRKGSKLTLKAKEKFKL